MKTLNLNDKRGGFIAVGYKHFNAITALSNDIRKDDKPRTGIQIFIRELETRNIVITSIHQPSEAAQFFAIEKAVRSQTLGHYSSQNSEDPDNMKFRGSVTAKIKGRAFQASTSGLTGDEDTYVSVKMLAHLFRVSGVAICLDISNHGGQLPECFTEQGHYLNMTSNLDSYWR